MSVLDSWNPVSMSVNVRLPQNWPFLQPPVAAKDTVPPLAFVTVPLAVMVSQGAGKWKADAVAGAPMPAMAAAAAKRGIDAGYFLGNIASSRGSVGNPDRC